MIKSYMTTYPANILGALAVGLTDLQSAAMAEAASLSVLETSVLLIAFTRPGSIVGDVAKTIGLSHSGAVRTIDRLVDGLLLRKTAGHDRRTVGIRCTLLGRKRAERALSVRAEVMERLLEVVPMKDRKILTTASERLLHLLPRDRVDAWRICRFCEHSVCRGKDCPVGSRVK